jgi:hypothetical protein
VNPQDFITRPQYFSDMWTLHGQHGAHDKLINEVTNAARQNRVAINENRAAIHEDRAVLNEHTGNIAALGGRVEENQVNNNLRMDHISHAGMLALEQAALMQAQGNQTHEGVRQLFHHHGQLRGATENAFNNVQNAFAEIAVREGQTNAANQARFGNLTDSLNGHIGQNENAMLGLENHVNANLAAQVGVLNDHRNRIDAHTQEIGQTQEVVQEAVQQGRDEIDALSGRIQDIHGRADLNFQLINNRSQAHDILRNQFQDHVMEYGEDRLVANGRLGALEANVGGGIGVRGPQGPIGPQGPRGLPDGEQVQRLDRLERQRREDFDHNIDVFNQYNGFHNDHINRMDALDGDIEDTRRRTMDLFGEAHARLDGIKEEIKQNYEDHVNVRMEDVLHKKEFEEWDAHLAEGMGKYGEETNAKINDLKADFASLKKKTAPTFVNTNVPIPHLPFYNAPDPHGIVINMTMPPPAPVIIPRQSTVMKHLMPPPVWKRLPAHKPAKPFKLKTKTKVFKAKRSTKKK